MIFKAKVFLLYIFTLINGTNLFALDGVSIDTWLEYSKGSEYDIKLNGYVMEFGMSEKFSVVGASAIGIEINNETSQKKTTAKDLALYSKYNFITPTSEEASGFSMMVGTVLPTGHNFLSSPNTAYLAMALFPMKLFDEKLSLLTQLGHRYVDVVDGSNINRVHWGVFSELNILNEYNVFSNFYTGSPYEIDVPSLSQEYGLTYKQSDTLKYRLLFGIQSELDGTQDAETTEYWGEVGLEVTIDYESFRSGDM
jgi:hypothetical protein